MKRLLCLSMLTCLLTGCNLRQPLYHWGRYEELLYALYFRPGAADLSTQIQILSEDIDQAHASGRAVPPGVHAQLGYLFYQQGNVAAARRELEMEKTLFPESSRFMSYLLEGLE